jgi:DNA topoisomerase II
METNVCNQESSSIVSNIKEYNYVSLHDHILLCPEMYVGKNTPEHASVWTYDDIEHRMVNKTIEYTSALIKIFDDVLYYFRKLVTKNDSIRISIDHETGEISISSDENYIPVMIEPTSQYYYPELMFGVLLSTFKKYDFEKRYSSIKLVNFEQLNFGIKLVNIFSRQFHVEIKDMINQKTFSQIYRDNMYKREDPLIAEEEMDQSYTKITFLPDYKKLGIDSISDGIDFLNKRVYDLAACTKDKINIYLNDTLIKPTFNEEMYVLLADTIMHPNAICDSHLYDVELNK